MSSIWDRGTGLAVVAVAMLLASAAPGMAATWTVCPDGCEFASIQEAVQSAHTGDRVDVKPGEYQESVLIDKGLSLNAENASATIILPGQGTAITIAAPGVTVQNISAQGGGDLARDAAIKVLSSQFLVQGCRMQGNNAGIYVLGGSNGTIQQNLILESRGSGIVLEGTGTVQVIRNTIQSCGAAGIELEEAASNTIQENNLIQNLRAGVLLHQSANNTVIGNNVDRSRMGLGLEGGRSNQADGNRIAGCELGISLDNESAVVLRFNRLEENEFGIQFNRCQNGTATGNSIDTSEEYGIYLADSQQILVKDNRVNESGDDGIGLLDSTNCTIIGNEVGLSRYDGIRIYGAPQHLVQGNTLLENGGYGINVDSESQGVLINGNKFAGNAKGEIFMGSRDEEEGG